MTWMPRHRKCNPHSVMTLTEGCHIFSSDIIRLAINSFTLNVSHSMGILFLTLSLTFLTHLFNKKVKVKVQPHKSNSVIDMLPSIANVPTVDFITQ